MKNKFTEKNKNVFKKIKIYAFIFLFSIFCGFILNCFVSNKFHFELDFNLFGNYLTWIIGLEVMAVILLVKLIRYYKNDGKSNPKNLIAGKDNDNFVLSNLEQSHFQTEKELKQNFQFADFEKLNIKDDGIPIKAEDKQGQMQVYFAKPAHTLVIGTTGSGKTTTFISPTIQILSHTKNKPSMLISDPKGELYAQHAKNLEKQGYEIKVLDLRNPYNSIKWNPLEKVFLKYQEMLTLENQVGYVDEEQCFLFRGEKYFEKKELEGYLQLIKQKLFDEVYEDLHDIVSLLCPVVNKSEPMWESGAKNFILAIALAMLEDSKNPELEMTKEKYNFYNIMKIATNTENDCVQLKRYFEGRDVLSSAVSLSKQVLDTSEKTRNSYLSTVFDKLAMFSDKSICALTSEDELQFDDMAEKPVALFLQIPDEKETRHILASMVILQAYKSLVAKANSYPDLTLPRSVYFMLDEFGNLPKINKLEQMITVGRSRKIWLCLVVQSYAQLEKVYDVQSADIIKSNCNIQIFIGSSDLKTITEFSKLCGNYSIVQRGVSFGTKTDDINSSVSVKERPLIYPSELAKLNNSGTEMGNAIVRVFGYAPIKSKFTPSFQSKKYLLELSEHTNKKGRYFDEDNVFYDIKNRNFRILEHSPKQPKSVVVQEQFCERTIEHIENKILNISGEVCNSDEKLCMLEYLKSNKLDLLSKSLRQLIERAKLMEDGVLADYLAGLQMQVDYLNNKNNSMEEEC